MEEPRKGDAEEAIAEELLDEIADLEVYAARGERPPRCRGYRIRINGERVVVYEPCITGRGVLDVGGFAPPEKYAIWLKLRGGKPERVELDEKVDLRTPGVEMFRVLPRDQTEG